MSRGAGSERDSRDTRDIAEYERAYAASYGFEKVMVEYRRRCVLRSLAKHPHRRILEVGCGFEPLFPHVLDCDRYDVVEPGDVFFEHAVEAARARPEVQLHRGKLDALSAELEGLEFDFIVASGLLHEVSDPAGLVRDIHGLCGPDTTVHFNVPNSESLHQLIGREMAKLDPDSVDRRLNKALLRTSSFSVPEVRDLLEAGGFEVLESGTFLLKPFTHEQMLALVEGDLLSRAALDGLDAVLAVLPAELGAELYVDARPR